MLKVGITGGIGSGKSLVSKILSTKNFPVFYSDNEGKRILAEDQDAKQELIQLFGPRVFNKGVLNRSYLSGLVFNNPEALEKLNGVVHPRVRSKFERFIQESSSPIVFNEAAILFETGGYKNFDKVILVTSPNSLRIERVMERDRVSEQEVRARMSAQWEDDQKLPLADYVITNDEKESLLSQVDEILKSLIQLL